MFQDHKIDLNLGCDFFKAVKCQFYSVIMAQIFQKDCSLSTLSDLFQLSIKLILRVTDGA